MMRTMGRHELGRKWCAPISFRTEDFPSYLWNFMGYSTRWQYVYGWLSRTIKLIFLFIILHYLFFLSAWSLHFSFTFVRFPLGNGWILLRKVRTVNNDDHPLQTMLTCCNGYALWDVIWIWIFRIMASCSYLWKYWYCQVFTRDWRLRVLILDFAILIMLELLERYFNLHL